MAAETYFFVRRQNTRKMRTGKSVIGRPFGRLFYSAPMRSDVFVILTP